MNSSRARGSLNDVIWAAAFVLVGALLMAVRYDDVMFVFGILSAVGGSIWLLLIRLRATSFKRDS